MDNNKHNKPKKSSKVKRKIELGKFEMVDTFIYKFWLNSEKTLLHIKTLFTTLN